MTDDQAAERGLELRRAIFGAEGTDAQLANAGPLTKALQEFTTEVCFGRVWSRPGLGLRDRSLVTVAMLMALGREPELRNHIRGAIANGVTPEEIRELAIHATMYGGLPTAYFGAHVADSVFDDEERSSLS